MVLFGKWLTDFESKVGNEDNLSSTPVLPTGFSMEKAKATSGWVLAIAQHCPNINQIPAPLPQEKVMPEAHGRKKNSALDDGLLAGTN